MKNLIYIIIFAFILSACEKDNFNDTGKANGKHNKSIMEYLRADKYNWDSTVLVIERAGLTNLFEGKDPNYPQITFLGVTKMSILRYMLPKGYEKVSDIPVEDCKKMILSHIISGKIKKSDVPKGISTPKSGGKNYDTLSDNKLWMYTFTDPWGGIPDAGPTHLYLESITKLSKVTIASSDIECNNGIVHSIHYDFVWGDL